MTSGLKHGWSYTSAYRIWVYIKDRCTNPNNDSYHRYGGRGITICDKWVDDPVSFCSYITQLPNYGEPGMTLDREDNDGDYEPGNLRWASRAFQASNVSLAKNNKSGFTGVISRKGRWAAYIMVNRKFIHIGVFDTIFDAVIARNKYIRSNNLPHKIQDYV